MGFYLVDIRLRLTVLKMRLSNVPRADGLVSSLQMVMRTFAVSPALTLLIRTVSQAPDSHRFLVSYVLAQALGYVAKRAHTSTFWLTSPTARLLRLNRDISGFVSPRHGSRSVLVLGSSCFQEADGVEMAPPSVADW
jgi:hypothetical protein